MQELQTTIEEKRALIFCGAGISLDPPAGLPDWHQLRDHTIDAVAARYPTLTKFAPVLKAIEMLAEPGRRGLTPEVVASEIQRSTTQYFEALAALHDGEPNANHVILARLARADLLPVLITTNFDCFLERALQREGVSFRVYRTEEELASFPHGLAAQQDVHVIKLHGCLSLPETITATVEQEGLGLSPAKAAVLDGLLPEFTFLFWGYSGSDLKIDLDYLRMVSVGERARGFFWNLHQSADFKETPNPNVLALEARYRGRGLVVHGLLPSALDVLVEPLPRKTYTAAERRTWTEQKTQRLNLSLCEWAAKCVGEAEACCVIGSLLLLSGHHEAAVECYRQMEELGRHTQDWTVVGAALNNLGTVLKAAGQFDEAVTQYREGLRYTQDTRERTVSLVNIGDIHAERGEAAEATVAYDDAERLAKAVGDREAIAKVYAGRAHLDQMTGQRDNAVARYRKAEAVFESIGAKGLLGECLHNRGTVHRILGELLEARKCFERASEIAQMLGDKAAVGNATSAVARMLLHAGETAEAREQFERARRTAEQLGDEHTLAVCLNDLATVDMLEGRRAQAAEGLRAAESLFMKTKDRPGVARVLQNLLTLYRELGRPQEAVETGHKAVAVLEELNDRALAAMVYRDTADLYLRELHQPAQAAQGYRIALTYARLERLTEVPEIQAGLEACQGGPRSVRQRVETAAKQDAIVVEVLAGVPGWDRFDSTDALRDELRKRADAGEDNDPDAAVALWRAVAALSWEMDDQNWLAGALNEAGMICHRSGELETAQWYYQEAGKAARSVHDWNQLGMCRYNLGSLLAERGERDAALAALKESEESAHRMGDGMKLRKIKELETRIRPTST